LQKDKKAMRCPAFPFFPAPSRTSPFLFFFPPPSLPPCDALNLFSPMANQFIGTMAIHLAHSPPVIVTLSFQELLSRSAPNAHQYPRLHILFLLLPRSVFPPPLIIAYGVSPYRQLLSFYPMKSGPFFFFSFIRRYTFFWLLLFLSSSPDDGPPSLHNPSPMRPVPNCPPFLFLPPLISCCA